MENHLEIVSRVDAMAQGLKWYFTGKPCNKGHTVERQVSNHACKECSRLNSLRRNVKDKEKINAKAKIVRDSNPEKESERLRKYADKYPEKRRAKGIRWRKANPEKIKLYNHDRRAREIEAGGILSGGLVGKLLVLQQGKCPCCGESLENGFHIDHIMPLVLGGSNTDDNIQLLTPRCNLQKNAKHPIDFMRSRGFLL